MLKFMKKDKKGKTEKHKKAALSKEELKRLEEARRNVFGADGASSTGSASEELLGSRTSLQSLGSENRPGSSSEGGSSSGHLAPPPLPPGRHSSGGSGGGGGGGTSPGSRDRYGGGPLDNHSMNNNRMEGSPGSGSSIPNRSPGTTRASSNSHSPHASHKLNPHSTQQKQHSTIKDRLASTSDSGYVVMQNQFARDLPYHDDATAPPPAANLPSGAGHYYQQQPGRAAATENNYYGSLDRPTAPQRHKSRESRESGGSYMAMSSVNTRDSRNSLGSSFNPSSGSASGASSIRTNSALDSSFIEVVSDGTSYPPPQHITGALPSAEDLGLDNLDLPTLPVIKALPARQVILHRNSKGDFGFTLRRGTTVDRSLGDEQRRTIIFAEPGLTDRYTGLLPGDRLVEVNNANVEDNQREDIIQMIRASNEKLLLKVQPVLELSELSSRLAATASSDKRTSSTTLQRSGMVRRISATSRMSIGGGDAGVEQGQLVWLIHNKGITSAKIAASARSPRGGQQHDMTDPTGGGGGGRIVVQVDDPSGAGSRTVEVDEDLIERANPSSMSKAEDVAMLKYLNESSLLHTLRLRYASNLIHTYAGNSLIVINPMHNLSIYSEKVIQMFRGCKPTDMPPHIYAMAQNSYRLVLQTRTNQSLVLMGPSGAGKTSNARHLMHYLISAAGGHVVTGNKLNAAWLILESIGKSRTVMNANASRFSQLSIFNFDYTGQIVSAKIETYGLEAMRVVERPEGEPTFHVFYQMMAGLDSDSQRALQLLDLDEMPNHLFTPLKRSEDKEKAIQSWTRIRHSMVQLDFTASEIESICTLLAAIILFGYTDVKDDGQFTEAIFAQKACVLLGIDFDEIVSAIRSSSDHFTSRPPAFASSKNQSVGQCSPDIIKWSPKQLFKSLIVGFYSELFNTVVALINRSLGSSSRIVSSINVLDCPGAQNSAAQGRPVTHSWYDLQYNYIHERLLALHHRHRLTKPLEVYLQEGIKIDHDEIATTQQDMVNMLDRPQLKVGDDNKGLLWVSEDSISKSDLLVKLAFSQDQHIAKGLLSITKESFIVSHSMGTTPIEYSPTNWSHILHECPTLKKAKQLLSHSVKDSIIDVFGGLQSGSSVASLVGASIRRSTSTSAAVTKRKSPVVQLKVAVDSMLDAVEKSRIHFIHCFLPRPEAGLCDLKAQLSSTSAAAAVAASPPAGGDILDMPLLRAQVHSTQLIPTVRLYRQGWPENMKLSDFFRRFLVLHPNPHQAAAAPHHEKQAVGDLARKLDLQSTTYRLGLTQIFLRPSVLGQLENNRDDKIAERLLSFQAHCRGYLARQKLNKLRVSNTAIRCVQKNIRLWLRCRNWEWWRLYGKVLPLLNVNRAEEELKDKSEELGSLKSRIEKLTKEKAEYKSLCEKLENKLGEVTNELVEEQTVAQQASHMLQQETTSKSQIEMQFKDLQSKHINTIKRQKQLEGELSDTRLQAARDREFLESDAAYTDSEDSSLKKEGRKRELDLLQTRLNSEMEEKVDKEVGARRSVERKLEEALTDKDQLNQQIAALKKRLNKINLDFEDYQVHCQDLETTNTDLEKRQKRFDSELSKMREDLSNERNSKEALQIEKNKIESLKYGQDKIVENYKSEVEEQKIRIHALEGQIGDLVDQSSDSGAAADMLALKRKVHDLESKRADLEDEVDDQAGEIQQLQAAKLKLEMEKQSLIQKHAKESEQADRDMEELRANTQKRLKQLEHQLEDEYDDKQKAVRLRNELEGKVSMLEQQSASAPIEDGSLRKYKREIKRLRAMLSDSHRQLEKSNEAVFRQHLKQLRDKLEDSEFNSAAFLKSKKALTSELQDLHQQLDDLRIAKQEADEKVLVLMRERNSSSTRVDEMDEDYAEIMKKYKAAVQQSSLDKLNQQDLLQQIMQLQTDNQSLKEQVSQMSERVSYFEHNFVEKQAVTAAELKVRDIETKLDLELAQRIRLESALKKMESQIETAKQERDNFQNSVLKQQENSKRLQREIRDKRDECADLQRKETDSSAKKDEMERRLDQAICDYDRSQSDLKLALRRIDDLQAALEADTDEESVELGDSDDDDDDEIDSSFVSRLSRPLETNSSSTTAAASTSFTLTANGVLDSASGSSSRITDRGPGSSESPSYSPHMERVSRNTSLSEQSSAINNNQVTATATFTLQPDVETSSGKKRTSESEV